MAIIFEHNNRLLIQKSEKDSFYSLMGGKVKIGESSIDALKREIKEELNASISIDSFIKQIEYDYSSFHLVMDVYFCHLNSPHIELIEAENAKWLKIEEIYDLDWLPADLELLQYIK